MKYYRYGKCMQSSKQPHLDLLISMTRSGNLLFPVRSLAYQRRYRNAGTIRDLIDLAYVLIKGKHKRLAHDYDCAVSKGQVQW